MSVTLTQSTTAGFPDRPRGASGVGLLVSMSSGNGGAYLEHDLGSAPPVLHVRFALNPATAAGGTLRIVGGNDAQREPVWWLDYDTDTRIITTELAGGPTLSATLHALPWHVIELKIDTSAEEATLWLNGVAAATASGAFSQLAARHVWIGGVFKDGALAGDLYLDEWCMAKQWIGPVIAPPRGRHADDPARWLVIYNIADEDAAVWAATYRAARHVPYANLLGLNLPLTEVITEAQFADLVTAIDDYLTQTRLDAQIMGILTGYRVPGYVDPQTAPGFEPVPALLHVLDALRGQVSNEHAADALPMRPTRDDLGEQFLAARIDGPNLDTAHALVQRATLLINSGLSDSEAEGDGDDKATLWLDPSDHVDGEPASYRQRMLDWVEHVDRMRTRLPLTLSDNADQPAPDENGAFTAVHHDGFLWSWAASDVFAPPAGLFTEPAGARVVSVQLQPLDATATTIRSATPTNWIQAPLHAGYAAAAATSSAYNHTALPYARPFFEALRRGWTLGEAWYLSLPTLRNGLHLVGDPLLHVAFPRSGWDIYGPLDRLESLNPDAPSHALREQQRSLTLPDRLRPDAGATSLYIVRHVDAHGRHEMSLPVWRITNTGAAALPPCAPAWPDHLDWPVHVKTNELLFTLMWERPLSSCHVAKLALRGEVDGAAETTCAEPALDMRDHVVRATLPMPTVRGRYRWRITSPGGAVVKTPWSRWIRPHDAANLSLHILGVQP